jgi:hypothetical protein
VALFSKIIFAIFKMRVIFKSVWVRKLIGKLGVPYNRRLRVRRLTFFQTAYHSAPRKATLSVSIQFENQADAGFVLV